MPLLGLFDIGQLGLNKDRPAHELPPEFFSDSKNMRFQDGVARRFFGDKAVFADASFTIAPYNTFCFLGTSAPHWVYTGLAKVYVTTGSGAHSNITRQSAGVDVNYTATADTFWQACRLHNLVLLNNGNDIPQYWSAISTSQKLQDINITGWAAATRCRVMAAYKSMLFGCDMTIGGTNYPTLVKWSHPAVAGSLPSTFDDTDTTKLAGTNPLDGGGKILDAKVLGDILVLYQESRIRAAQYIGGTNLFRWPTLLNETGILSTRCVQEVVKDKYQVFATGEDIVKFDGAQAESILERRMRKWLNNVMDSTYANRSFMVNNPRQKEVWFCFPTSGATFPNMALIWNQIDNQVYIRELAGFAGADAGPAVDGSSDSWDSDSGTWDTDGSYWDQPNYRASLRDLVFADQSNVALRKADTDITFNGTTYTSYVERTGFSYIGKDRNGNPKADTAQRKLVTEVWPRASGASFNVRVGSQEYPDGPVTWGDARTFNPATMTKVDALTEGRYIAVRFESIGSDPWELRGYDLNVNPTGMYSAA